MILKRAKTKVCTYQKLYLPLKILGDVNTIIGVKTKFLEGMSIVVETKSVNLLSGITSLALGLIQIDKREHMCFSLLIMRKPRTHKKKVNEAKIFTARLRKDTKRCSSK